MVLYAVLRTALLCEAQTTPSALKDLYKIVLESTSEDAVNSIKVLSHSPSAVRMSIA